MRVLRLGLGVCAAGSAGSVGYLLVLLAAAAAARLRPDRTSAGPAGPTSRFLVLIPAHDEEPVIGLTLDAVRRLADAPPRADVVIIADHCTDATPDIAAAAGATVLLRESGTRTKGAALDWAITALRDRLPAYDAVLIIDADTLPSPNLLQAVDRRMRLGARVVQVDNRVSNAAASTATGLRDAAFRLMNTVRPLGKARLGLSAGLRGTGMVFRRDILQRHGWPTSSVLEDFELHMALLADG